MSIVEIEAISPGTLSMLSDPLDQRGVVPLMHNDHVRRIQDFVWIQPFQMVAVGLEERIGVLKFTDWFLPVLGYKVLQAPGIMRFTHVDLVPTKQ
jgi:hypothetical protein